MPRKTLRVRDISGRWVEIEPGKVCQPRVRHRSLNNALLDRIALVYQGLRDVLIAPVGQTMSLEQFEVSFMRCVSPSDEVRVWEAISLALENARGSDPTHQHDRAALYQRLILMLCGGLTDEELREEESAMLLRCFRSSLPPSYGAIGNERCATICYVCYKRVSKAGALFCPQCGRKLTASPPCDG